MAEQSWWIIHNFANLLFAICKIDYLFICAIESLVCIINACKILFIINYKIIVKYL